MGKREQEAWGWLVIIAAAILLIIALFKVLFWISITAAIVGTLWLVLNTINGDHEYSWIPALLLIGGGAMACISYQIGYGFEKTPEGNQTVNTAKAILQVEDARTSLPTQEAQQTTYAAYAAAHAVK